MKGGEGWCPWFPLAKLFLAVERMTYKSVDDLPDWFQEEFDEQELIIEDLLQKNENLARTINKNKVTIHNLQLQVTSLTKQHE